MKILVIGKEGRLQKNANPAVYARHTFSYVPNNSPDDVILAAGRDAEIIIVYDCQLTTSDGRVCTFITPHIFKVLEEVTF